MDEMVWEETWGVHSKLTLYVAVSNTLKILNIGCPVNPRVFKIFILCFVSLSWREVTFCLKNGRKGSPTQGVISNRDSVTV